MSNIQFSMSNYQLQKRSIRAISVHWTLDILAPQAYVRAYGSTGSGLLGSVFHHSRYHSTTEAFRAAWQLSVTATGNEAI